MVDNADGTVDPAYNPGANDRVFALTVQPPNKTLVGGHFNQIGGQPRARLARLNSDGSADMTFDPGVDGDVYVIVIQPDNKILIGGAFTAVADYARANIARLNADGTIDPDFNPGANGPVHAIAQQGDGKIYLAGEFTQVAGQPRNRVARLHANGVLQGDYIASANDKVYALAKQADGKLLLGGNFTEVDGEARAKVARLRIQQAALQTFAVSGDGSTLNWGLTSAAPEFWRTTFEVVDSASTAHAASESTFTLLGAGERTADGWRLSGLDLALGETHTVRVRGYYGTGISNGSGSVNEAAFTVFLPKPSGEITFIKVVDGGTAQPDEWRFDVVNGPAGVASNTPVSITVGSYEVNENGPSGYTLTGASGVCNLAGGQISMTVTEAGGICTITNTLELNVDNYLPIVRQSE